MKQSLHPTYLSIIRCRLKSLSNSVKEKGNACGEKHPRTLHESLDDTLTTGPRDGHLCTTQISTSALKIWCPYFGMHCSDEESRC